MSLCQRMRWTVTQFRSLSLSEQDDWLAWEALRQERAHEDLQDAVNRAVVNGKTTIEGLTANLLLLLVRELSE